MTERGRDNQKNKCYAWERAATKGAHYKQMMSLEQAEAMVRRIWRGERGRYGLAKSIGPEVHSKHHGSATASHDHKLRFPKWALNEWVVLHEMAHRLTPHNEAHGPRFIGVLIGLVCRHMGEDRERLLALAYEMGVRVHEKSIGAVPHVPLYKRVERYLPGTPTEIAVRMNIELGTDVNYKQVQGAALRLIRDERAKWKGDQIVRVRDKPPVVAPSPTPAPKPAEPKRLTVKQKAEALASEHDIEIDRMNSDCWAVYPPESIDEDEDPHAGDHVAYSWAEVLKMVEEYVALAAQKKEDPACIS